MSADKTIQDVLIFDDMSGGPILEKKSFIMSGSITISWSIKYVLEKNKTSLGVKRS
jgi:hypothetical protein